MKIKGWRHKSYYFCLLLIYTSQPVQIMWTIIVPKQTRKSKCACARNFDVITTRVSGNQERLQHGGSGVPSPLCPPSMGAKGQDLPF